MAIHRPTSLAAAQSDLAPPQHQVFWLGFPRTVDKLTIMSAPLCPFCAPPPERIWVETDSTTALFDAFPVAEGHTLVIPKRHVASIFDLPNDDLRQLWEEVAKARQLLRDRYEPDGFNIGVNDGEAAGQTVSHAHIHIIPRKRGDVTDPRGGIRWVIPGKAKYW